MARSFATVLFPLVRHDGAWLRCVEPQCDAYWGDFRPTAWVAAKAQQHAAKAHGAKAPRAQAGRPQRRAAAAPAPDAGLIAAAVAAVLALGPGRLGRGVSREVFPFGPEHVLKVAYDPSQGHNLAEANAYAKAPAWARPLLAPVVAHDPAGKWLLMRKADRVGKATWSDADTLSAALRFKVQDLHTGNIGWLDGRWVAIDYAGGQLARDPWA